MRKKYIFGKKLYISILTMIVVLLTTVATTFAWVGVFANSTFDIFNIDIKGSDLEEYGVELSVDGINFGQEISFNSLKRQILKNWGYQNVDSFSEEKVDKLYSQLNLDQCSTVPIVQDNKIQKMGDFYDIFGKKTNSLFKFDIYVSATQYYESETTGDFKLDLFLTKNLLTGSKKTSHLWNAFTYPEDYINPYDTAIGNGTFSLPNGYRTVKASERIDVAKVDSKCAARVAFEKYDVVEKYHPEQYTTSSTPNSAVIYQDSYEYPVYDETNNIYDFGGILPDEENLAIGYYNSTEYVYYEYSFKSVTLPNDILNTRSVLGITPDVRISSKTNHIIDSNNPLEQIGVNQMMKITCYFWFEGWDSDCFPAVNYSRVFINIGFVLKNDEEF